MKKLYLIMIFLAFFGFSAFCDSGEQEEIGFLLFSPNRSDRFANENQAKNQLDDLAKNLREKTLVPGQILVYGYSAVAANRINSADLSRDRALFVKNELQKRGVSGNLFSDPVGHGEVDTWGRNTSEAARRPNRRVRVLLDVIVPPAPPAPIIASPVPDKVPDKVITVNEKAAAPAVLATDSSSKFPWKILFLLLGIALLAAIIFLSSKAKKRPMDKVVDAPSAAGSSAVGDVNKINENTNIKRSKFMDLENVIRGIITSIPSGVYFDLHTVTEKLLQEHDDVYLMNVGQYTTAAHYHSKISSIITQDTDLVELIGQCYSKNIHDKYSECHLFKRK